MRIYVGPGVLYFTRAFQYWRCYIIYVPNSFNNRIIRAMIFSKLHLRRKPWIGFAQYSMSIARHYLTRDKRFMNIVGDLFFGWLVRIELFAHFFDPADYFLV